jgi:hypothetical protein
LNFYSSLLERFLNAVGEQPILFLNTLLKYCIEVNPHSKAEQTFLIQLACDVSGYLPTEKAEKGGHYSAFVSSGNVGHIGGEQLVRQTLTEINKLF